MNHSQGWRIFPLQNMAKDRDQILDELLVLRCQGGSRSAFEQLVDRWYQRVRLYIHRKIGDYAGACDVTQEVWSIVIRKLDTLRDPALFPAWILQIARNSSWAYLRKHRHKMQAIPPELAAPAQDDPADLADLLEHVPSDCRQTLVLYYLESYSIAEIARRLAIAEGTVKSRLYYGRQTLKTLLENDHAS